MKTNLLWFTMMVSCFAVAVLNVVISHYAGINIFTFRLWFVVPVGSFLVGMAAASGAMLAARMLHIRPTLFDAVLSALFIGAGTMALIHYLDYYTLTLKDGRRVRDLIGFVDFLDFSYTKTHMRLGRSNQDLGEAGAFGYVLAALELLGFIGGVVAIFAMIRRLPSCAKCALYLKKISGRTTKELTLDEASGLHAQLRDGDVGALGPALAWDPPPRKLDKKAPKARMLHRVMQCPNCAEKTVYSSMQLSAGRQWRPAKGFDIARLVPADMPV